MAVIKVRVSKVRRSKRGHEGKRKRDDDSGAESKARSSEWDSVCAICDDGGRLLCCDGGCVRSFHPTEKHGTKSKCTTLELTKERWQALKPKEIKYTCENCTYKQHQCFACGLLGSSDLSSRSEVFQCKDQKCGHYYHPKCVAKLLYPNSKTQAFHCKQDVAAGLEFHCPIHRCSSCKEAENKDDTKMQFALCRRCPTAYHRKCLPRDISFEASEKKGTPQRAWDNILADRILIYCMKHEIKPELSTPKRDHIVFPETRDILSPEGSKDVPKEQEDKLDHPLAKPSQSPRSAETGHDHLKPIDSFAPKHLFPRPQPGSCGWLDELIN